MDCAQWQVHEFSGNKIIIGDNNTLTWPKEIKAKIKKGSRFQNLRYFSREFKSITKVLPVSRTEIHPVVWRAAWRSRSIFLLLLDFFTFRPPWFWGTSVHCGLRWLWRLLCSGQSHGTRWLAAWTARPDTGTGRSGFAPLQRKKDDKVKRRSNEPDGGRRSCADSPRSR